MSNLALARKLGLSPSAMLGRVRRLEKSGAIRGYRAVIDPAALDITVRALVVARLHEHSEEAIRKFEESIKSVPGVRACGITSPDSSTWWSSWRSATSTTSASSSGSTSPESPES